MVNGRAWQIPVEFGSNRLDELSKLFASPNLAFERFYLSVFDCVGGPSDIQVQINWRPRGIYFRTANR